MKITPKNAVMFALGIFVAGSLAITSVAMASTQQNSTTQVAAQTNQTKSGFGMGRGFGMKRPGMRGGIIGGITAISGNTITVLGKDGKTYTVDATGATITVNGTASTITGLVTGDQIIVKGTPSTTDATKITAKMIAKGTPPARPALTGFHYQIIGQITAISGNTITVKDGSGTIFTIDASTANITVNGTKSAIANLAVNDEIMVGGKAADGTTTQITANQIRKGTEKFDLSLKKEGLGKGFGMGRGHGIGKN